MWSKTHSSSPFDFSSLLFEMLYDHSIWFYHKKKIYTLSETIYIIPYPYLSMRNHNIIQMYNIHKVKQYMYIYHILNANHIIANWIHTPLSLKTSYLISQWDISSIVEEQSHYIGMAIWSSPHKRCLSSLVSIQCNILFSLIIYLKKLFMSTCRVESTLSTAALGLIPSASNVSTSSTIPLWLDRTNLSSLLLSCVGNNNWFLDLNE